MILALPRRALLLAAIVPLAAAAAAGPHRPRVVLPDDVVPAAYRLEIAPDAQAGTFEGRVEVDVQVRRPTRRIVLNAADLAIDSAQMRGEAQAPAVRLDARRETATLQFDHAVAAGAHTLVFAYHGRIFDEPKSLFRLRYGTPEGERIALFTQFEQADARRMLPCWDEPGLKATFELSATVPDDRTAIGNMPEVASEALPDGRKRVHFAPTPRMSSYLLFFGMGDFERIHREVDGVDVGVVVQRGDTARATWALDAAAAILPFYNTYFGVRYPLPKMDMVAGAGSAQAFGAMENWGALFYFDHDLLVDPRLSTEADRQRVFVTVAHEMAHQWFGDLVTMAWWDDLWLNEGFASWMENKAAERVHPEWRIWLQSLADKQSAMESDARAGTHPLVMDIPDITVAPDIFDSITYGKGAQVIRTLEASLGEDAFRAGLRRYMKRHAYGNAVTDDLWSALDESGAGGAGTTARELSRQPGVPLVELREAHCEGGRTRATLAQGQFAIDADPMAPRTWHLPVRLATLDGGSAQVMLAGARPQEAWVEGCGPLVVNAGQTGYFRTAYAPAALARLAQDFARLGAADQLGLLNDTAALASAGREPMAALMALAERLPADADPVVADALVDLLSDFDRLHHDLPSQDDFRRYARTRLQPFLARTGFEPHPGEDPNEALLRTALVEALGRFNDPAVTAEVEARFARFAADPDSLQGELRHAVLEVVATRADAATWARLHALAAGAVSHLESRELYAQLAIPRDRALVRQALDLALSGEPPATTVPVMLRAAADREPELTLQYLQAHWDRAGPLLAEDPGDVVTRFLRRGDEPALVGQMAAFARGHVPDLGPASVARAQAAVRWRVRLRAQRMPEVDRWIAKH